MLGRHAAPGDPDAAEVGESVGIQDRATRCGGVNKPADGLVDREQGPQLLPHGFRGARSERTAGAEVVLDLVEGQLDLPALPVAGDQLVRRVLLGVQ
nr:hypothetical protein [Streptomyces kasugaensis]